MVELEHAEYTTVDNFIDPLDGMTLNKKSGGIPDSFPQKQVKAFYAFLQSSFPGAF